MRHATIEAEFAAALTDPGRPVPTWALSPRGTVDTRRFAVYRNNVHVGLVSALRAKFPATARLVGEEFFTAMARVYVAGHKPSSPLMVEYGDDLPDFIAAFAPARALPYLPEVARLEVAWTEAYHAADGPALQLADLAKVPPDVLPGLSLTPHPAARRLASRYPVGSIWAANQTDTVAPVTAAGPESVLITRPAADVGVRVISAADDAFCAAVCAGRSIEDAAATTFAIHADFDPGAALAGLVGVGAFAAFPTQDHTQ